MSVEYIAGIAVVTGVEVSTPAPRSTHTMTADQICQAVMSDPTTITDRRTGKTTGELYDYMQAVSVAVFDPARWKAPVVIIDPEIDAWWVMACVQWFHGVKPTFDVGSDGTVVIRSTGYAC